MKRFVLYVDLALATVIAVNGVNLSNSIKLTKNTVPETTASVIHSTEVPKTDDSFSVIKAVEKESADVNEPPAVDEVPPIETGVDDFPVDVIDTDATSIVIPSLASDYDIELLARTIWGEAGGIKSKAEQAAVAWCVLNRVDTNGKSIEKTVLAPYQFAPRLRGDVPVCFIELAQDVVNRWEREHAGYEDVGRTLPIEYLFFVGDGQHNHFAIKWQSRNYWDWSLPDPYTEV